MPERVALPVSLSVKDPESEIGPVREKLLPVSWMPPAPALRLPA